MPANRTIEVKALSRVEGEGALYVKLDGDTVEHVELNIFEPPRFFEAFLVGREIREVPDITARICGICPVAYQMSACHALEKALGLAIPLEIRKLRRLLYCGEWIESHALHIYLLHAPDFLGYESGISLAADHREVVEKGLRMKKIGNELLEVLGGRAIHPINVTVGGFHRAPRKDALQKLLPDLEWGLQAAIDTLRLVSGFDFPDLEIDYDFVCIKHPYEFPMNEGRVVSSGGLDIAMEEYEKYFEEEHVKQSNALHSVILPGKKSYLVGPLARVNLCFDQLLPDRQARGRGVQGRLALPQQLQEHRGPGHRADPRVRGIDRDHQGPPARAHPQPRAVQAGAGNRLPRDRGPARAALPSLPDRRRRPDRRGQDRPARPPRTSAGSKTTCGPTSPRCVGHDDAEATRRCEHLIRNYDPCISCATHFLKLKIER